MDKNPITKKPPIDETPRAKSGKHKKRETLCEDKRRGFFNCHICGSEDITVEQLVYCTKCGKESYDIGVPTVFWRYSITEYPCACKGDPYQYRNKTYYKNAHLKYSIRVCSACGSVESKTCPSCHKECWTSPFGEKRCGNCGYRHPGYRE